ncbi:hypothetical protein MTR67_041933, partial [Solanum verrucosum]
VGDIAGDVLYVIQKLLPRSINKDDTSKISLCSIQILEKTKDLKAQVETYYKSLKFTPSQFPTFGGLSFLDSLLRKLNEMSKSKSGLGFLMKPLLGNLEKELSSLTSILEKELSSIFRDVVHHEHKIPKDLQRRTINLAYEAEVAIDSILAQYNAFLHIFCSLPTILKEIIQINAEVTEMWSDGIPLNPHYVAAPFKHLPARHSYPVIDEELVGFENKADELIDYLIRGSKDNGDTVDVLADMLRRKLMGKRYLIVLDDMWDCMVWDDLRLSFPDVGNRSRIVVTTRLEEVGKQVKYHTDPYSLPFLTIEESCQLLQKKVFQKEDCPSELQDVSQAVAEKCKELPLVVVLVAGIIIKRKMEESWWIEVKDALFDYLDSEFEEYSLATMQLSFDNLPHCLKPCLLYMGMFSEDARISASKLISLWIAEGFVENTESGRLMEEEAEGYLMDLISSNVVMLSKRSYNANGGESIDVIPFCQISELRLLKVLDLISYTVEFLSLATFKPLNQLKYLAVLADKFYFDPGTHLPHIETLIVKNFPYGVRLPVSFLEMEKLRHAHFGLAEFDKQGLFEGSSKLENLRILKKIVTFPIDRLDVLSRRCPNLQQLQITFEDDEEPFCPKLENLTQLQELQLSFVHPRILSGLQLPSNLNKLVLKGIHIESAISFIAELPSLEYLQLQEVCFPQSEEWCLGDIMFHKLKLLKLVQLGISRWDASEESFPLLETLVIKKCIYLEEIPLSFVDIPSLKQIKLIGSWKESLEDSAVRIKGEIKEIEGCDRIHLVKEQSD